MITPLCLSGSLRYFSYSSPVYSCYLFLISSASVRSIPFLSFIEPIFAWTVPLVSLIFLKGHLVFTILLFSSISLHWSLRKTFLSLRAILWNSAFRLVYLAFSPLSLASVLFLAICKAKPLNYNGKHSFPMAQKDRHFAFLHLFFLGMVLVTASCTMSRTLVHSLSGTLSIRSGPLNLLLTSTV